MLKMDLGGVWQLQNKDTGVTVDGTLPGCNYLDLVKGGVIPDPFREENEKEATKIALCDYEYSRNFTLSDGMLGEQNLDLVITGPDTIAEIQVNGNVTAHTDNAFRTWRFPIRNVIKGGDNSLRILFKSPLQYIRQKQAERPFPKTMIGPDGVMFIRKPPCHFGWDWGPQLPPSGVSGSIRLEAYSARLEDIRILQLHKDGRVMLKINPVMNETPEGHSVRAVLSAPDGKLLEAETVCNEAAVSLELTVDHPMLWQSNGLGEQHLYGLTVILYDRDGKTADERTKKIGLRTIELDTSEDPWGNNFRFKVNGVPIFAKGADWIPSDSFVTRTSYEDLKFYIEGAKTANMNILRVWGGGYYESDDFYDLCDEYGILVWQDMAFACMSYPLDDENFLENVRQEVRDNVRRLRHHASLALWCGNNEIQMVMDMIPKKSSMQSIIKKFFSDRLPGWIAEDDAVTPYWPGSPNSGSVTEYANKPDKGDVHLWQVWHGMQPLEYFRGHLVRFCSEFGMESFPSMKAIRSFTDDKEISPLSPVMKSHQKSAGGNEKIIFYLLSRYRYPKNFSGFIYLSQLIQAETIRMATEAWRREAGRCNGAIYWQYNDCWPVASWAGIDYLKEYKAVQYKARHFNAMLCVSNDLYSDRSDIYVINEYPAPISGTLTWRLMRFDGTCINKGAESFTADGSTSIKLLTLACHELLKGCDKREVFLHTRIEAPGNTSSEQYSLLLADSDALLKRPNIKPAVRIEGTTARLSLQTDTFARHVCIDSELITSPLSDNFFDLEPGLPREITFSVKQTGEQELLSSLRIHSLADTESKGTRMGDKITRLRMFIKPRNFISYLIFKRL